jgi:polysaccharide export outer membrane protein
MAGMAAISINLVSEPASAQQAPAVAASSEQRLIQLGAGDQISLQIYGQPDMSLTTYVSDDGTIPVALAGPVQVAGMSPSEASIQIDNALKNGGFLLNPSSTITVLQSKSQRISVLGEVGTPGRYPVESNTTIFDLLSMAGGTNELSSEVIYVLRPNGSGGIDKILVNLKTFSDTGATATSITLKNGDSVYVPKASMFYIMGAVTTPNAYKLEQGMTVMQAIALGGGLTETASSRRIEIKRTSPDGKVTTLRGNLTDVVQPDDVIRVKESIF